MGSGRRARVGSGRHARVGRGGGSGVGSGRRARGGFGPREWVGRGRREGHRFEAAEAVGRRGRVGTGGLTISSHIADVCVDRHLQAPAGEGYIWARRGHRVAKERGHRGARPRHPDTEGPRRPTGERVLKRNSVRVVFVPSGRLAGAEPSGPSDRMRSAPGDDRLRRGWLVGVVASRGPGRPRKTPGKTISADSHEYALAA